MKKILPFVLSFLCAATIAHAQGSSVDKINIDVFVCADSSTTTPLNALRAELTHEIVNNADSSYVVTDRTDEIWTFLRKELDYQDAGFVRDDQLVIIGEHFGAQYLCVVNVTKYEEFGQYFFEGTVVDILSRAVIKHSYYPQDGITVSQLDPQTQLKVGKELATQLGINTKDAQAPTSASASATVTIRRTSTYSRRNSEAGAGKRVGDYYTGEHTFRGRKYESTHGRNFIIGYLDYTGEHGLAYMDTNYTYWPNVQEDTYIGAYIADVEQLLKIYRNKDKLKLAGEFWSCEVTRKGTPGNGDDTYRTVNFSNGKTYEKKHKRHGKERGLYVIVF